MSSPIYIVSGLPRSGTSLMMRMLEAAGVEPLMDDVRAADEDNPRGYYEFDPVRRAASDATWIDAARDRAVKVVLPLLQHLPHDRTYRVVVMRRDLGEVVASQQRMLARSGQTGAGLPAEVLESLLTRQLDEVIAMLGKAGHIDHVEVDYNALLADPADEIERVRAFVGRGDAAAMRAVIERGLYRNRDGSESA